MATRLIPVDTKRILAWFVVFPGQAEPEQDLTAWKSRPRLNKLTDLLIRFGLSLGFLVCFLLGFKLVTGSMPKGDWEPIISISIFLLVGQEVDRRLMDRFLSRQEQAKNVVH